MTTRNILTVLEAIVDPALTPAPNPYTSLLVASLPKDRATVMYFSWRRALMANYDLVHIHWPEQLFRHRHRAGRLAKGMLAMALLIRLRLTRRSVVRTVHNTRPHESGPFFETFLLNRIDQATTTWVVMNSATEIPAGAISHLVPHGHYREWFDSSDTSPTPGRLLSFGLIRPYKGTDRLIRIFGEFKRADLSLHIVGRPSTELLGTQIAREAKNTEGVHAFLEFVSDERLATEIRCAEIVVLPYMQMGNSGAAILALSLHRPVLLPDTPTTRLLLSEFGPEWVSLFSGELTSDSLGQAINELRSLHRDQVGPDMRARDWALLGDRLADVFEDTVAQKRN